MSREQAPRRNVDLRELAAVVAAGDDLEGLTRPLLALLRQVTGLDTTFLTTTDRESEEQRVLFSLNAGNLTIAEGLTAVWGDVAQARAMGIMTYLSVPVLDAQGAVVGTLCGVSTRAQRLDAGDVAQLELFACLIAGQLARDAARAAEIARMAVLEARAESLRQLECDPLTGLLNRAGVQGWLSTALVELRPGLDQLAVAFIRLDRFKAINDMYGRTVAEDVLRQLASTLGSIGRQGDLHGRLGGDEFVVAAMLPSTPAALAAWTDRLRHAAVAEVNGIRATATVGVGVANVSDPELTTSDLLHRADGAMYRAKAATGAGTLQTAAA